MNTKLLALITSDLNAIDVDQRYAEMLDECYPDLTIAGHSFSTSRALLELDPTAYRCGMSDWMDGENFVEVGDDYYDGDELDALKEQLISDLESEVEGLEEERDEEMDNDEPDAEQLGNLNAQIETLNKEIEELNGFVF